jgi:putative lipase involved disintegration of autophagic bodies
MAKLSKEKEYAIKYLLSTGKSAEEIAQELEVKPNQVAKFVVKEELVAPAKIDKTKDLMIRQTSAKKNNSVSIMTQAASQVGDEFYKSQSAQTRDTSGHIFKPRS